MDVHFGSLLKSSRKPEPEAFGTRPFFPGSPLGDSGLAGLLALADALPVFVSCLDREYRYLYVNRAYEEQFQRPASDIVGHLAWEILGRAIFDEIRPFVDRALQGEHLQFEHSLRHPVEGQREVRVNAGPWCTSPDSIAGYYILSQNVTKEKTAERALRRSEARQQAFLRAMPDVLFRLDREGRFLDYHAPVVDVLIVPPGEFLERSLEEVLPAAVAVRARKSIRRLLEDNVALDTFDYALTLPAGRRVFEARLARSGPDEVIAIIRDVTEARGEAAAAQDVAEDERRRIAQDLHDDLGQHLTGLAMRVRALEMELEKRQDPALASAEQLRVYAERAMEQLRSIARSLTPLDLTRDPFSRWVERLAADLALLFHIECRATIRGELEDPIVATQLYRIVQESVTNAARHAGASTVSIELHVDDDLAVLSVDDDGSWSAEPRAGSGMGLETMRHRARSLGGRLSILPRPEGGTRIACETPSRSLHPERSQGGNA